MPPGVVPFDEAVQLAEEAFIGELNRLVSHLSERLSGQEDGKPKVFRDTAVETCASFSLRFQQLNVRRIRISTDWSNRPNGSCGVSSHNSCGIAPHIVSRWLLSWQVCRPRSTD